MTIYLCTCTLTLTELFYQIVPQLLYVAHDDDGLVLFFSACCTNEQKREREKEIHVLISKRQTQHPLSTISPKTAGINNIFCPIWTDSVI